MKREYIKRSGIRAVKRKLCRQSLILLLFFAVPAVALSAADDGERLFQLKCSSCHGAGKSKSKGMTEKEWRSTVLRMISNGAVISREDTDKIVSYLAANYPKK